MLGSASPRRKELLEQIGVEFEIKTSDKEEIYESNIRDKYSIWGVFDDRNSVVDMWRSKGLTCFQVYYGDF